MLFILRPEPWCPHRHVAATVVNGPAANDWHTALRRGHIHTPPAPTPAPPAAVGLQDILRDVRAPRRHGVRPRSLLAHVRDVRVEHLRDARAQHETVCPAVHDGLTDRDNASVLAAMKEVRDHGPIAARHLCGEGYEVGADGDRVIYRVLGPAPL